VCRTTQNYLSLEPLLVMPPSAWAAVCGPCPAHRQSAGRASMARSSPAARRQRCLRRGKLGTWSASVSLSLMLIAGDREAPLLHII
jgi:hypothetical protein